MILEQIADELVHATSALLNGRTVNVMNPEGVIIASTEPERIGTVHSGAVEAVRTRRTVQIRPEDVPNYPGAKQGCNMPIKVNGEIYGVVGIFGNPEEIQDTARLFELYVSKYLEAEALALRKLKENDLRLELFRLLTVYTKANAAYARTLADSVHFRMEFPMQAAIVSLGEEDFSAADPGFQAFLHSQIPNERDLFCVDKNRLLILHIIKDDEPMTERYPLVEQLFAKGANKVCVGSPVTKPEEIKQSYQEAKALLDCANERYMDVTHSLSRVRLEISLAAGREENYLKDRLATLRKEMKEEDVSQLLESARVYYRAERSVQRAAERLFIHKNTLQYRMKRLLEALDLEGESPFTQEFLVRMLLCYRDQHPADADSTVSSNH